MKKETYETTLVAAGITAVMGIIGGSIFHFAGISYAETYFIILMDIGFAFVALLVVVDYLKYLGIKVVRNGNGTGS